MKLVNLTGRDLTFFSETTKEPLRTLPKGGRASVQTKYEYLTHLTYDELPIEVLIPVEDVVTGLPDPEPGVCYVVSGLVMAVLPERVDLLSPGKMLRDPTTGKTLGCRTLNASQEAVSWDLTEGKETA